MPVTARGRWRVPLLLFVVLLATLTLIFAWSRRRDAPLSEREKLFSRLEYQPVPPVVTTDPEQSVAALHPKAREIGMEILKAGGNAYDAFVATTLAEYVLAEGGSSIAGPLGALVFDAASNKTEYLDADFNTPLQADATKYDANQPGTGALVPGAPAGLEALAKRGKLGWSRLVQPAIELARSGFLIPNLFAGILDSEKERLRKSEYARRTYFRSDGTPLKAGDLLVQPDMAAFLTRLQEQAGAYVYQGEWGGRFLQTVRDAGGALTQNDLRSYQVRWTQPWTISYRGYTIYSASGRSYGGPWTLLFLKTLEHADLASFPHYSTSADSLETVLRTAREVWTVPWLFDCLAISGSSHACTLDHAAEVQSHLERDGDELWSKVVAKLPAEGRRRRGSHSYHVIAADRDGNVICGTHTMEGSAWGDALFVEGVPLTNAGMVAWGTRPGERRLSPLTMHLALRNGKPAFAEGAISNSVVEASAQFVVNLIDYQLPPGDAASKARFGTFVSKGDSLDVDWSTNWLSPDIGDDIVATLKDRGINVQNKGIVDTGLGTMLLFRSGTGEFAGQTVIQTVNTPLPYVPDPFGTTAVPPKFRANAAGAK